MGGDPLVSSHSSEPCFSPVPSSVIHAHQSQTVVAKLSQKGGRANALVERETARGACVKRRDTMISALWSFLPQPAE
jgi:hypothetical protein